jgi:hypothetical protein
MSKPIFIWRVPLEAVIDDRGRFEQVQKDLQAKLSDYHVLSMTDPTIPTIQFECYNTTDLDTKSFEQLKEMVKESMDNKQINER